MPAQPQTTALARRYNAAAPKWHHKMTSLGYDAAYDAAISRLCPQAMRVDNLMDAGCGTGNFAASYLRNRGPVSALSLVDPASAMLHEAASRLAPAAQTLTLHALTLDTLPPDPAQDLILCAHVIDHCPDPAAALAQLGRMLAPGGAILLITTKPHWCNALIRLRWGHQSWPVPRIHAAITAAGLLCTADCGFAKGPPRHTSHAFFITQPKEHQTC
jgi:ubiquinone/menaquinone biosynthesis C-methylase UbiE